MPLLNGYLDIYTPPPPPPGLLLNPLTMVIKISQLRFFFFFFFIIHGLLKIKTSIKYKIYIKYKFTNKLYNKLELSHIESDNKMCKNLF